MNEKNKRFLLLIALWIPFFMGWMYWVDYQTKKQAANQPPAAATAAAPGVPSTSPVAPGETPKPAEIAPDGTAGAPAPPPAAETIDVAQLRRETPPIIIRTAIYDVSVSPIGAVPVRWDIVDPRYALPEKGKKATDPSKVPDLDGRIELIDPKLGDYGMEMPLQLVLKEMNSRFFHEFNRSTYTVIGPTEDNGAKVVRFESPVGETGLQLIKTYRIPNSGFSPSLKLELVNKSASKISFNNEGRGLGLTLGPGLGAPSEQATQTGPDRVFSGQRYDQPNPLAFFSDQIKTLKTDEVTSVPNGGMNGAGLENRYFLMTLLAKTGAPGFSYALVEKPDKAVQTLMISKKEAPFYPQLEVYGAPFTMSPGETRAFEYDLFVGPKDRKELKAADQGLDRVMFHQTYGWIRALCLGLMWMLTGFHTLFHNWGAAIIALVILLRLLTLPLTQISMKQQAKMAAQQAKLKPQLDKIKEKHKDNPTKLNQAQMELFREHGVNPLGALKGCVWVLLQLPIFISLYKILLQDIDLRGAGFLWIHDLSQPDKLFTLGFTMPFLNWTDFNLLPILTAVAQFFSARMSMAANPASADNPTQKQMMYMMPGFILFIMYTFPSGLALYWLLSNVWQIFQQKFVNKSMRGTPALPAPAKP